ncbi:hypothetical protein T484DRAFT_1794869 [Baffinella frigidus]|nr:hypothetical protein T484DRAFT_1794869 [Cryptophyta sp. CCMP2293]
MSASAEVTVADARLLMHAGRCMPAGEGTAAAEGNAVEGTAAAKQLFLAYFERITQFPDADTKAGLARESGYSVAQVSTWFINARKRLSGVLRGYTVAQVSTWFINARKRLSGVLRGYTVAQVSTWFINARKRLSGYPPPPTH